MTDGDVARLRPLLLLYSDPTQFFPISISDSSNSSTRAVDTITSWLDYSELKKYLPARARGWRRGEIRLGAAVYQDPLSPITGHPSSGYSYCRTYFPGSTCPRLWIEIQGQDANLNNVGVSRSSLFRHGIWQCTVTSMRCP